MISSKPDILDVLHREGTELRQRGHSYWSRCPLHQDKTPSFKVDPERQTFRCFGCDAHGDVIDFVMQHRKVSFKEALDILGIEKGKPYRPNPLEVKRRQIVKVFGLWCRDHGNELARELRSLKKICAGIRTPEDIELCAWAYHKIPVIEYKLDVLQYGSDEAKHSLREEAMNGNI